MARTKREWRIETFHLAPLEIITYIHNHTYNKQLCVAKNPNLNTRCTTNIHTLSYINIYKYSFISGNVQAVRNLGGFPHSHNQLISWGTEPMVDTIWPTPTFPKVIRSWTFGQKRTPYLVKDGWNDEGMQSMHRIGFLIANHLSLFQS